MRDRISGSQTTGPASMSQKTQSIPPRHLQKPQVPSSFEGATVPDGLFKPYKNGVSISVTPIDPSLRNLGKKRPWFWIVQKEGEDPRDVVQAPAFHAKMLNWIQIVTTPTADTPGTCLLFHYDNKRYLFGNVSEGTQRALVQRKISINKIEDVFISGPINYHNTGGLLGMVLTLADVLAGSREQLKAKNAGKKDKVNADVADQLPSGLNIHGGKNLAHYLATARRFIFRKGLPMKPHEVRTDPRSLDGRSSEPDWSDSNIKVWYVPLEVLTAETTSQQSRKRGLDETSEPETSGTPEDQAFKATVDVVTQMFNSNWRMDALVETTLHEAKLPAKLWVRGENGHIQLYNGPLPGRDQDVPNIPVLVRQPWPASMIPSLPHTKPARQSICYIVKNHDRRGKFDPKAAAKYDIPKPEYRNLTMGKSVTAKDGTVVTPEMVLGPDVAGQGFALLDIPDESYVGALVDRPEWANADVMKGIVVMYWTLGPDMVRNARVQEFMKKHSTIRHIVCSGDTAPNMIALESVATQALKLHNIDQARFPIPYYTNDASLTGFAIQSSDLYELGRTGKTVQFSPQYLHQDDKVVGFPDLKKLAEAEPNLAEVARLAAKARSKVRDATFSAKIEKVEADIPNRDAEVITLGTGSALPSKYRNVSATMVRVPGYGNYLFDAGENTLGQLRRVFGKELPYVLRNLKVIWISHLHADHHLGTASIIRAWNEETRRSDPSASLHVASHTHMLDWLREYGNVEDYGLHRLTFTEFKNYDPATRIANPRLFNEDDKKAYGLERIDACFVDHCQGALATVFTWPTGLKVAYSGDCRPSKPFVQIGQGTTLLIHESTFDDELSGDAVAKKHSTMAEAIDVGRQMGARRIMLTHFSQRYQKVPNFEESYEVRDDVKATGKEKAKFDEVILVAFDYMHVKLGEFRMAQAFLPAIQKLLEDVTDQ